MKRKDKKRIVVELIILIALYIVVYCLYRGKPWPLIGALPSPLSFIAIVSALLLFTTSKDIKDYIREWRKPTSPKSTSIGTLEVKNIEELEAVADNIFFMENPAVGKIEKKERTWHDVKKEIDFSKLPPIDISGKYDIFFITGEPGAGKSTYLLWSLDKFLERKSWWRPAKKKIVFLNPDTYGSWAEELAGYDSRETLLVIDSLYRLSDTGEIFRDRCSHLFKLAFGGMKAEDDEAIGPFKVIATIRKDEYEKLLSQKDKHLEYGSKILLNRLITCEDLDFKKILKNYLVSYGVSYNAKDVADDEVIRQLLSKSRGLPYYIRLLVIRLKATNKEFSKESLDEFPSGMANLIWDTITKLYYSETDIALPFLLLLLSKTDKYFSIHFMNTIGGIFTSGREEENKVLERITGLRESYFSDSKNIVFAPNSIWKDSLRIGLEQPNEIFLTYKNVVDSYRRIDEQFNRLLEKITKGIETRLQEGFKDKADDFLCVDLAKLSEENLTVAADIYIGFCSSHGYSLDYKKYVQEELYELWISNAWKYRAVHNDDKVINCYENAFDRLGVRSHPHQLHAYACYLQKEVLPKCNYGKPEWQKYKEQIENLYQEVIEIQSEQGVKDSVSYQSLASFYKDMGGGESGRTKALGYYERAEKQFTEAIEILEGEKKTLSLLKIEKTEKKILHDYALCLMDKTKRYEKELSEEEKINEYTKIDELFDKLLRKYRNHSQSIRKYSRFLMDYAGALKKYNGGENLQKAENLLKGFITAIEDNKANKDVSYFMALHVLALYYYRSDYNEYRGEPRSQEAEKLLKKSSQSSDDKHNSVANSELGRLYLEWAKTLEESDPSGYCEKIKLAEGAYEEAIKLPENRQTAPHLIMVYSSYAFYFQYAHRPIQSEECVQKALYFVDKYSVYDSELYYSLTTLGEKFLKDYNLDPAFKIFSQAANLGISYGINPSFAIYRLGEIYKQQGEVEKASEYYLKSARLKNTSENYRMSRSSIKELMDDYNINPGHRYYNTCMQARVECSEKAYKLDPNSWPNCGNYGEDLFKVRRDKREAMPILEKGIELLQHSTELNEVDKKEHLEFFYYFLEKIERRRRKV